MKVKVSAIGIGSEIPVDSISRWSKRPSRASRRTSTSRSSQRAADAAVGHLDHPLLDVVDRRVAGADQLGVDVDLAHLLIQENRSR
jgi:hypothetical protein